MAFDAQENAKEYYGEKLQSSEDLKTSACCSIEAVPAEVADALKDINSEIKSKFYGCGSTIPGQMEGLTVVDMGCGTGRDVYIMSKLVGSSGFVTGIDMTENQLKVANKYIDEQTTKFGYSKPNVNFVLDTMENVGKHFDPDSVDLVTSNCVLNLAEDKEIILKQIYEILKDGGEFYFSDVYADRRIPASVRTDPVVHGECLGGSLYIHDFIRIARKVGFADPRLVSTRVMDVTNADVKKVTKNITFYSNTYRLFKINGMEERCEDFGHVATLTGDDSFTLDSGHSFEKNKPERVCGNTALMLSKTRLKSLFKVEGTFDEHFGDFESCGTTSSDSKDDSGCC